MRWGENETYQFVKIYLNCECLWNTDHEHYKFKDKRQKAYQAIIAEFMSRTGIRINESELKVKIRNLKSTYSQEIAKIRTRSSPNSEYIPTIKWFADWHRCFKQNLKKSVVDEEQTHTDESNNKAWIIMTQSDDSENVNNVEDHSEIYASQADDGYGVILKCETVNDTNELNRIERQSSFKEKRKKINNRSSSTDQSETIYRGSLDSNIESVSKEDEFDIYGRYIATQLRKMDLQRALRLQLEIQSLVSEARIADLH
ncbi:unnamed protein product [Parnassius apollo]|uniref:(apollo) hypothetical protein n=1 Tax=Parnassius apollo TaxID=110799 RepID=A0A8S3X1D5_PARAO|nr:unnamed protein product [Parnassius apollo]